MELFDNKTKLLGDDLRNEMIPGSKIKVVASFFSIYAYETLKNELESVEELEFIFPAPTFVSEGIKGTIKKEVKEFYIPKQIRESSLYGTEFEIRLRNQLTQRVIARECSEWIEQASPFEKQITCFHETRHAFQWECINGECLEGKAVDPEIVDIWKNEVSNYNQSTSKDIPEEFYLKQKIEIDAIAFVHYQMNKLFEVKTVIPKNSY